MDEYVEKEDNFNPIFNPSYDTSASTSKKKTNEDANMNEKGDSDSEEEIF